MNSAPVHGHEVEVDAGSAVDTGTIAWLLPEIARAFDTATTALRAFRASAAGVDKQDVDLDALRVARSHLHQAHGALELGEIAGVTQLTGAIEDLFTLFEKEPERCDATALDAIIGGCRAIVEYLEDLQAGARQQPLYLFPSYRELLLARGVDRIHPADLILVDLDIRPPRSEQGRALGDAAMKELRSTFEQSLLRYIRDERDATALTALSKAVKAIDGSVGRQEGQGQQRAFWWVTRALFEAMANDGFDKVPDSHTHLKRHAGRVNLQIRKLVEGSGIVAERLLADTLFFVALARPVTPHVTAVQSLYRLADAVPTDYDRQRYGRIDMASLRTAREALAAAKPAWSALVAGDVTQIRGFAKDTGLLVDAVGALKRRGLSQVAQVIDGIATDLGFDPRQPSAAVGLDVATALLFLEGALERARALDEAFDERAALVVARVEASAVGQDNGPAPVDWLDRMSREAEERLTVATFVAELQANLRNAEKVLDGFFRDPTDRSGLNDARKALAQASGALALLGHDDVHRAIDHAGRVIEGYQPADATIDPASFEPLARSLGAVGFYVDQIKRERIDPDAFRYDTATGRFSASMGRASAAGEVAPPAEEPASAPIVDEDATARAFAATDIAPRDEPSAVETADADDAVFTHEPLDVEDRSFAATQILEPDGSLEEELARRAADATDQVARLRAHPDDEATRDLLATAIDDVRRSAMLIDDRPLQDEASAVLAELGSAAEPLGFASAAELADRVAHLATHANRSAGVEPPSVAPVGPLKPVAAAYDAEAIDAELLEIFLEEAGGVLVDAESSMRVLDADPLSATATTNLRRGFHTLKGSGRMVGLTAFGEAAWSIEDTLNDHIAGHGAAPTDLRALIDYAIHYLSDWVGELRTTGNSPRIPDALIEAARAVREARSASPTEAPARFETFGEPTEPAVEAAFDDDFAKTTILPTHDANDDPDFAATQVLDVDPLIPDLEFFGLQPAMPEPAAGPPEAATASTGSVSDPDFATFLTIDDAAGAPADPAGIDAPVETIASAPPSNVVPFTPPAPTTPTRNDDVRQIGSVSLSVALFNIYLNEADELLRVLTQDFAEWRHELDRFVSDGAMRAAHSLAGSSATVGLVPAHDLAAAIEEVLYALFREPIELTAEQVGRLQDAVESLRRMLHRFAAERMPEADPVRVAGLLALRREIVGDEAATTPLDAASVTDTVASTLPFEPLDFDDAKAPIDEAIDLAPVDDDPVFALEIENELAEAPRADEGHVPESFDAITTIGMSETPFEDGSALPLSHEPQAIDAFDEAESILDALTDESVEPPDAPLPVPAASSSASTPASVVRHDIVPETPPPQVPSTMPAAVAALHDDLDPELLDIFVTEGGEILPQIGTLLRTWQGRPADAEPARLLLRHLHTLKGSARMAGAMRLGEMVHEIEARVESAARLHEVPSALLDELLAAHDRSLELFDLLQHPVESATAAPSTAAASTAVAASSPDAGAPRRREPKQAKQQAVRIQSETLDRLVNLAGEVSISRARIENEVLQIKGAMSDLNENVERLRDQLREIELQAEFQMQSQMQSHQAAGAERDKFDPLEFDRFTRFQELTRMMAESVNDVKTLQQHLQKSLETAEVDLSSQRRMTRDLQQDLMRVRMVPFSSIAERLYRVARRTAKEVDKRVNLDIRGGSVEIDRGVLERMAGPFEHMLRNHIVHGIETRDARRAAGKDETGELLVEVRQEGNEIVLTFSDDGAGLDHERIRGKGRELGLIDGDASDARVAELIFHPGFSTASEVTELAGRGVGMDVVRAEAVTLAGRVSVDSETGRGTRFTINLPVTLAITQVVLVAVASRVYALPAVLVEQVQQLRPQPLADAYRAGHLSWAGADVRLSFLGTILGIDDCVPVAQRASPVLILRSAGERIAVHVDEIVGNQEVVVKNLGPQLARMTGIAGATVLGSGDIVLILNPVQLAQMTRREATATALVAGSEPTEAEPPSSGLKTLPTVMVVDDSLTVRRVTQRLLSREGYQVVLAKDGVDALEQLQDYPPDVMLVDIEMPRMDGFDLTRNVRSDERYRHIPIIMITSRTAEKHRRHAAELGVDAYIGKPYQEDELLDLLTMHVRSKRSHPA